jgi:hypothetical protein
MTIQVAISRLCNNKLTCRADANATGLRGTDSNAYNRRMHRTQKPRRHLSMQWQRNTRVIHAPHSLKSCQAAQRRRDGAGEFVAAEVQVPAGHTNSHRVTPWHPTPTPTPASRTWRIPHHNIKQIKSNHKSVNTPPAHAIAHAHNRVRVTP